MDTDERSVAVVGGGLAGLAAAVALAERGFTVNLFESRCRLGGRASSFADPMTGELIDYCQHVSMGCCTNLADLCRRLKIDHLFERVSTLHFIGPEGRQYDVAASRWLPAPLHLLPSLMRLGYLSPRDRWRIGCTLLRLARSRDKKIAGGPTMGAWLRGQGQSSLAIERFWSIVLVSALGESIEKVSAASARKVFVDGFLANRSGYEVLVPTMPLGDLYGSQIEKPIEALGVRLHFSCPVQQVELAESGYASANRRATGVTLADGTHKAFDYVVLATSWRHVAKLLPAAVLDTVPEVAHAKEWTTSPITGVHLWFDRPITTLTHAVLVGRLSQWMFYRGFALVPQSDGVNGHYYQVVVSAAHELLGVRHPQVVERVCGELQATWPARQAARLLHSQVVTEKHAVFSPTPGLDARRPAQRTPISNLTLAGDWTATLWPATMESAVRSGYLAAEAVLDAEGTSAAAPDASALLGKPAVAPSKPAVAPSKSAVASSKSAVASGVPAVARGVLVDDLPRAWLARWLLG